MRMFLYLVFMFESSDLCYVLCGALFRMLASSDKLSTSEFY